MQVIVRRACAALVSMVLVGALAACGGGGGAPADDSGPPVAANHVPVAVIASADAASAGAGLAFDASGSSDADGDALVYTWDFGDGGHGGGARLAHIYSTSGSMTVTLTVSDGKGGIASMTKAIAVGAGPAAGPAVPVTGYVGDANGPLAGVAAQQVGGAAGATSDAAGRLGLSLPTGVPVVLRLSKSGYADQTVVLNLPSGTPNAMFKAGMQVREAAVDFDAGAGAGIVGKDGATVVFPAGALVDAAGNAVTGTAQVAITPVDIRDAGVALFPGAFAGIDTGGAVQPIASHGTAEFMITQGGQKLQLAAGATATIELPIYAALHLDGSTVATGDEIPLWSLDETSGQWVQEGSGTVVASASAPSGLAMRASVGHFTWWNSDAFLVPPGPYEPTPRCYYNAGPEFVPVARPCSIGPLLPGEYRVSSVAGRSRALDAPPAGFARPPSYAVRADIPAEGGVALPVPSGLDFTLYACSDGGLNCGQTTVNGAPGASDAVRIDLYPLTQAGCGTPLAVTLPVSQDYAIADVATASCFTFHADAGQVIASGVVPNSGSSLNGRFELLDPSGNTVDAGTFSPATAPRAVPLRRIVATSGDYRLVVTAAANSPAGGFTLQLAQSAPTLLAVPTVAATIDTPANTDFAFPIAAGQTLAASVRDHAYYGSAVSLLDASTAAFSPSGFDTYYAPFTFTAAADGVAGFTVLPGQLTGDLHPKSIISIEPMLPLAVGDVVTGAIASGGEVSSYAFAGHAGDIVFATAQSDPSGTGNLQPYLRMLDPQAKDLASLYGYGTAASWRAGPFTLTQTGTYRLDAFTIPTYATPSYSLRVVPVAAPVPVALDGPVTTASGSIDAIGDLRYYTLTLAQGDVIRASVNSPGALGLAFDVLGPDTATPFYARAAVAGLHLETAPTSGTYNLQDAYTLMVRAPQAGDYTVRVMANSSSLLNALGPFSFVIDRPVPAALAAGTPVSDSLDAPYGAKRYAVTIAAAGDYRFCIASSAWVQDELRDASGTSLTQTTNRNSGNFMSPEFVKTLAAGAYTLDVFQRDKGAAGFSVVYRPAGDAHPACQ